MKIVKLYCGITALLLFPIMAVAQSASSNFIVESSGTINTGGVSDWIDASGGTEITLGDDAEGSFAWPFAFDFYDDSYTTSDNISVVSNGFIRLDGTGDDDFNISLAYSLNSSGTGLGQIIALGVSDCNFSDGNSHVYYTTTGSAPNQVLTIEFVEMEIDYNDNKYVDIEVSFYQTTNHVVIRLGTDDVTQTSAEIGLHSGVSGFFNDFGDVDSATNNTYIEYAPPVGVSIIDGYAVNNTAISTPMLFTELQDTGVLNLDEDNIAQYRIEVNAASGVADVAALQTIIDAANIDVIDNFASTNTAISGGMTLNQLTITGVSNLEATNLDQYRTNVNAESGVANLTALQTIIDGANIDVIDNYASTNTAVSGSMSSDQLEVTGVTSVNSFLIDEYRTAIDAESGIADLTALQAVVDAVNAANKNDDFADAFEVLTSSYTRVQDNTDYTTEGAETGGLAACRPTGNNTMWFYIVPDETTDVTFEAGGLDCVVSLWSGTTLAGLSSEVACQDSDNFSFGGSNNGETFTESLTAGTTYYFRVEPYSTEGLTTVNINGAGVNNTWNGTVWSNGSAPDGDDDVVLTSDLDLSGDLDCVNLTISSNNTMTVGTGETLSVSGNVIIEAGGELVNTGTVNVTGTSSSVTTVDLTADSYSYYSSPINAPAMTPLGTPADIYFYTEATDLWDEVDPTTESFTNAIGYAINYASNTGITLTGTLNDGSYGTTVTNNGTYDGGGWNLVGNPYPSAIDADIFLDDNSSVIDHTVYLWDDSDYATHNGTMGVNPSGGATPTGRVGVAQGFFVRKTTAGSATVNFTNSMRLDNGQFYRRSEASLLRVRLENEDASLTNAFEIHLMENASYSFDADWDSEKLKGNPNMAFYSVLEDKDLILQSIPTPEKTVQIPMGYDITAGGMYKIVLENTQNLPTDAKVVLIDQVTGEVFDIQSEGTVAFNLDKGSDKDRFALRITRDNTTTTEIDEQISAYVKDDVLHIHNMSGEVVNALYMYDMTGRVILNQNNANSVNIEALPAGIYMLKMQTTAGDANHKLYID